METIKKTSFDRLYALQLVAMVTQIGSFVGVARKLDTAPSNITKEIKKLEDHLGITIFKRSTRSLSLTEEGQLALNKFQEIIYLYDEMGSELRGENHVAKGILKITAPTSMGENVISHFLANFQKLNPYIEIKIHFADKILDPIEQNIDLSIRVADALPDSSYYAKKVGKLERVICASPLYLKIFKTPKTLKQLPDHNCLLYMRGASPFYWNFEKREKTTSLKIQGSFRSNNLKSLLVACEKGIGIGCFPKYLVQDQIEDGTLVQLFKSWSMAKPNIYLVTGERPSKSKRLETLVNYLSECFEEDKKM